MRACDEEIPPLAKYGLYGTSLLYILGVASKNEEEQRKNGVFTYVIGGKVPVTYDLNKEIEKGLENTSPEELEDLKKFVDVSNDKEIKDYIIQKQSVFSPLCDEARSYIAKNLKERFSIDRKER